MGYQALLFCPDEKTARTVAQVLSELEFAVVPCTEPFAAVKKLMGEHFDAIVVDCDNEQNATLLFKSARNTTHNQSALAVAVVEGQAGVAKAFRIGANLVLTKPINVEQAKGTLRVARGLLRKNEAAKPATGAANTATKTAPATAPPKLVLQHSTPSVAAVPSALHTAAVAAASAPTPKPAMPPMVVASSGHESAESDSDIFEIEAEVASPEMAAPVAQASAKTTPAMFSPAPVESRPVEPKIEIATTQPARAARIDSGAASAPARAREPELGVVTPNKPSTTIAEPENQVEEVGASGSSVEVTAAATAAFTFGGNVSDSESAGGKRKKALLAVAAILVLAVVGYEVWAQWERSSGAAVGDTHAVAQPAPKTAAKPNAVSNPASSSLTSSAAPSAPGSVPATPPSVNGKAVSDAQSAATSENASSNAITISDESDSPSSSASSVSSHKVPATKAQAQPIVIKSGDRPSAKKVEIADDAPAPSLNGIANANSGALPNLMAQSKAPTPVLQTLTVSQGVSQGLLLKKVQPVYPPSALARRVEGAVQITATISPAGNISAVKVLSGDPQLAKSAADAVKQWKYKPYLLNGSPVEIQTPITVNFKLPQ
jgi:TonB family protein